MNELTSPRVRLLRPRDAAAAAAVHMDSFPDFFLASMGSRFLSHLYRGFATDPSAVSLVIEADGQLLGVAVGTLVPQQFYSRLLRRRFLPFASSSALQLLRRPTIAKRLARGLKYRGDIPDAAPSGALLSSICIATSAQGLGIGTLLIREWEREIANRGLLTAYLTTDAVDNDLTQAFYDRNDWNIQARYTTLEGRRMLRYVKHLTPSGQPRLRVSILNAYYEPEVAPSNYLCTHLCEELVAAGHNIDLIVPTPTRGVNDDTRARTPRVESRTEGAWLIRRLPAPREGSKPFGRAVRYLWVEARFLIASLRTPTDVFFLYSTPPTQGALGGLIRRLSGIPVVYNVQDLFPDSLLSAGIVSEGSLALRLGLALEQFAYRNCDSIAAISPAIAREVEARSGNHAKVRLIRNWIDADAIRPIARTKNQLFSQLRLDPDAFYVSYTGNIGHTQNFELLIKVARSLSPSSRVRFLVLGDGGFRTQLLSEIETHGLTNIVVRDFQPASRIGEVFNLGDVGLVISKRGVGGSSVPSKTWHIMAAARPVLASFDEDSELATLLRDTGAGVALAPDHHGSLVQAIEMLVTNPELLAQMGSKGRQYVRDHLTRDAGTRSLQALLAEAATSGLTYARLDPREATARKRQSSR